MTADLKTQIRDFAEEFAGDLPIVDIASIVGAGDEMDPVVAGQAPKSPWPQWAPAALAAFLVIVLIGGAAFLLSNEGSDEVVDTPPTPSVVEEDDPEPTPTMGEDVEPGPTPTTAFEPEASLSPAAINGLSWQQTTPEGIDPIADVTPALVSGGDRFHYIGGEEGLIRTSFDGINWTTQQSGVFRQRNIGEFVAWQDTIVGWGCGGGFGQEGGPYIALPSCVGVLRADGDWDSTSIEGVIESAAVGPPGIVIAFDAGIDHDVLIQDVTGSLEDLGSFGITDGVMEIGRFDGTTESYVLADYGYEYTDMDSLHEPIGWFSSDGREWTPIPEFPMSGLPLGSHVRLTGTADGFFALVTPDGGEPTAWHSANGLDWRELGPIAGDPWTLGRWQDGAVVFGPDGVVLLSADGIEVLPLSVADLEDHWLSASGGVGTLALTFGPSSDEFLDAQRLLYSPSGEEWIDSDLPAEMNDLELVWGWFSPVVVATDDAVMMLLYELAEDGESQSPVWFLGTPTTD